METFLDKVPDTQLRNKAKLLTHRCRELEKIIRARETHLVEFGKGRDGSAGKRSADGAGKTPRSVMNLSLISSFHNKTWVVIRLQFIT